MPMTVKKIYDSALAFLGETPDDLGDGELAERASYIIAGFCADNAELDRDFRETHTLPAQDSFSEVYLELEEDFPLSSRFSRAAALYTASMLVIDENESLSDSLFEKYCDALSRAVSEIPFAKGKIHDIYS